MEFKSTPSASMLGELPLLLMELAIGSESAEHCFKIRNQILAIKVGYIFEQAWSHSHG